MKKYLKEFLHRGMMFGGFGPIVTGFVYLVLSKMVEDFSLNGVQIFTAILSTYVLAFAHAGASVFNQIESWPVMKSLLCHFSVLFIAYTSCYLINSWIPFDYRVILSFIAIFVLIYFVIWFTVYFCVRATTKKLNSTLN